MRRIGSRGFIAVALAAGSLLAVPLAAPATAAAPPATCSSPKSTVNLKKLTATFVLTACTNPAATGGSGSAVVNFKKLGTGKHRGRNHHVEGHGDDDLLALDEGRQDAQQVREGNVGVHQHGQGAGRDRRRAEGDPEGFAGVGDDVFEPDHGCVEHLPGNEVHRLTHGNQETFVGAAPASGAASRSGWKHRRGRGDRVSVRW